MPRRLIGPAPVAKFVDAHRHWGEPAEILLALTTTAPIAAQAPDSGVSAQARLRLALSRRGQRHECQRRERKRQIQGFLRGDGF